MTKLRALRPHRSAGRSPRGALELLSGERIIAGSGRHGGGRYASDARRRVFGLGR